MKERKKKKSEPCKNGSWEKKKIDIRNRAVKGSIKRGGRRRNRREKG